MEIDHVHARVFSEVRIDSKVKVAKADVQAVGGKRHRNFNVKRSFGAFLRAVALNLPGGCKSSATVGQILIVDKVRIQINAKNFHPYLGTEHTTVRQGRSIKRAGLGIIDVKVTGIILSRGPAENSERHWKMFCRPNAKA